MFPFVLTGVLRNSNQWRTQFDSQIKVKVFFASKYVSLFSNKIRKKIEILVFVFYAILKNPC